MKAEMTYCPGCGRTWENEDAWFDDICDCSIEIDIKFMEPGLLYVDGSEEEVDGP